MSYNKRHIVRPASSVTYSARASRDHPVPGVSDQRQAAGRVHRPQLDHGVNESRHGAHVRQQPRADRTNLRRAL